MLQCATKFRGRRGLARVEPQAAERRSRRCDSASGVGHALDRLRALPAQRAASTISANGDGRRPRTTPCPRASIRPRRGSGARPKSAPPEVQTTTRSSATSRKPGVERPQRQVALAGARRGPGSARRASSPSSRSATRPACRITRAGSLAAGHRQRRRSARRRPRPRPSSRFSARMRAAVRLDDLAGDREPQARVAAERRALGPGGVEALEHRLQVLRRHAGPVVVDLRPRPGRARALSATRTSPPGGRERAGVVDQVAEHLAERPLAARHRSARRSSSRSGARAGRPRGASSRRGRRSRAAACASVDRPGRLARQLGVEPRGVGDVGDQPVEPADVLLQDAEQPIARRRRPRPAPGSPPPSGSRSADCGSRAPRRRRSARSPPSGPTGCGSCPPASGRGRRARRRARRCRAGRWRGRATAARGRRRGREPPHRLGDQLGQQRATRPGSPATAMRMNGISATRSAAMIWSTSPASSVSTPSTVAHVLDRDRDRDHPPRRSRTAARRPPCWPAQRRARPPRCSAFSARRLGARLRREARNGERRLARLAAPAAAASPPPGR